MSKWTAKWIVATVTTDGNSFSECFDTLAGAKVYAAAVKAGMPDWKTTIKRV